MKTIIVPTDFSPVSINAMNYAVALAKETESAILLFHAYQVPVTLTEVPIVLVSVDDLQKNAEDKIAELKKGLETKSGGSLKIYAETILGDTVDELGTLCEKIKPFAVVMGTSGASGIEKVLFGSTTLSVIKHLTWPVIVVPPGTNYKHVAKVGLACDLRNVVETTPEHYIKDFVNEFHSELHILNVDTHHYAEVKPETAEESLMLQTIFEDLKPQYHFISDENVETGINRFAEENNLDLVITIPKKHNLLEGLFKKSHTKQLVFGSHVPIMCVHE